MNSFSSQDILFDDFALLEKHIGCQQLVTTSVNTNCDCASSPTLSANDDCVSYPQTSCYDDCDTVQIAPTVSQAD